ncbi:MAG: hypothetical protein OXF02_07535 [Simkaniaceae bacterium]|nr:hypothetical protein [Simkaniaceae bacterium]
MLSGIVLPPVPQTPDRTRHNAGSPDRRRSQQPKTSEKKVRVSDTKASQSGTTQPVSGQTGTHQPPVTLPSLREERKVLKRTKKALDEQISRQEGRTPAKGEAIRQVNEEIGTMHTLIRNGRVAIRTACATDAEVALQLSMQKHHLSLYRQCIALQRRKLNLLQQHRS